MTLANGRSAWFTGIVNARSQSSNSDAINGFALVDARTGKANVYYEQGISAAAAGRVIEGAVQDTRYTAATPVAYNVHGALTYVTTLKDAAGNPRLVGMVSALDRSVVATGSNLEDVTRLYGTRLRGSSQRTTKLEAETQVQAVSGVLLRSGGYTSNGQAFHLVRLDVGGEQRDYTVDLSAPGLRNIVLARSGDRVNLSVYVSKDGTQEVREVAVDTPTP